MSDFINKVNTGIKWSFYAIFFLVPLVLYPKTFELFEFNKLWITFAISAVILFFWISKMILVKRIIFRRTPFDIPLGLFLLSQVVSTFLSIEPHVSFWGYYSRFNGGLLSLVSYIFLYYAFVNNLIPYRNENNELVPEETISFKVLLISLLSGLAVAVWGLPSHFGYDLTCLAFRGTLDVSCWTEAFQPTIRIFSTLGQPNWLAAYFSILIPVSISLGLYKFISNTDSDQNLLSPSYYFKGEKQQATGYFLLSILLFIEVLWTQSQSGFLGLSAGMALFFAGIVFYLYKKKSLLKTQSIKNTLKLFGVLIGVFVILSFFLGHPLKERIPFSTFQGIVNFSSKSVSQEKQNSAATAPAEELGGSDSGKIRLVVWRGALDLFNQHPLFGTGVETFAYAYYKVKPLEHNLLSEWDYLYNKAHNEYLNYLATTGIFGLGTYLLFIVWFLYYASKKTIKEAQQIKSSQLEEKKEVPEILTPIIYLSLVSSFITILVSNFFGFSVVIINLYLFIIPAIFLGFTAIKSKEKDEISEKPGTLQVAGIALVGIVCLYFEFYLLNTWLADQEYSLGYNLDRAQEYVAAGPKLENAVKLNPGEDLYKNELALNLATLGLFLSEQNQTTESAVFVGRAKQMADDVIKRHPQNVVFYKTRIQTYFVLSQLNDKYYDEALKSIKQARKLAPTDAKIAYNEGLLYGQKGDLESAVKSLKEAIRLKPNYRDPRYAISVYLIELSKKEKDAVKKEELLNEAKMSLNYTLKNIIPDDPQAKELLKSVK